MTIEALHNQGYATTMKWQGSYHDSGWSAKVHLRSGWRHQENPSPLNHKSFTVLDDENRPKIHIYIKASFSADMEVNVFVRLPLQRKWEIIESLSNVTMHQVDVTFATLKSVSFVQ